nr:WD repeat-containing protein 25-like [Lytechinus pictus]
MDRIQVYASSDSESDHEGFHERPLKKRTFHQPRVKIALQASAENKQFQFHSSAERPAVEPQSRGYGTFLHINNPSRDESPNSSIYGSTRKEKQRSHNHHVRHSQNNGLKGRHVKDHRQEPPPLNHQYDSRSCEMTFDILHQRTQECRQNSERSQDPSPMYQQDNCLDRRFQKQEQTLKRNCQGSGLTPYVPKRLRKSNSGSLDEDQRHGTWSKKYNPDIFSPDPVIESNIEQPTSCSKPPKRLFCNFVLHEGPVTHVEWNIPQFSHLLLSSSMDKTVRIWNYSTQRRCVQTLNCHEGAVKDAQWNADGQLILSCGFDKTARLSDARSGTNFQVFDHSSYVTCIKWHPTDPHMFISGSYGSTMYCWDTRTGSIVHQYAGKLGQILAVEFINNGTEFVATCDTVSRDSTDRTIMVWDTKTAALLSNQLYHEKYTCCSLRSHPTGDVFMAQSNANYIALFSTSRPYRLNKYQRFEGHQVEGYRIGCDCSPDGSFVASGSSDGKVHIYSYSSTKLTKTLGGGQQEGACTDVAWHPVVPGLLASCSWDGKINVWT